MTDMADRKTGIELSSAPLPADVLPLDERGGQADSKRNDR